MRWNESRVMKLIPSTELSSRLPGETPSSFILTGCDSDPRFLGGGYEGLKFPRMSGKSTSSPVSRFLSIQFLDTRGGAPGS